MKRVMVFTALFLFVIAPRTARGQNDDKIQGDFEVEYENIQIKDIREEQNQARIQALRQEKETRETEKKLAKTLKKKDAVGRKAKRDIAIYEARRKRAEARYFKLKTQLNKLELEIKYTESNVARKENQAKDNEQMVSFG